MKKSFILLALFLAGICTHIHAQQKDSTVINKDSVERAIDEFLSLLDSVNAPKSYFYFGAGIGNQQFSLRNIALNAQQSAASLNLMPEIGYQHKSGLGILYNNFLSLEGSSSEIIQHTITPTYDYTKGKNINFGFSYTRYFGRKENSKYTTPYQNDFFSYIRYVKGNYRPSLSMGFANGSFKEVFKSPLIQKPDTLSIKVSDFSLIPSLQREFAWKGFGKKDYIMFYPAFLMLFASNRYTVNTSQRLLMRRPRLAQRLRNDLSSNNSFGLQSLGINADLYWYVNKFYLNPQVYFDYYTKSSSNNFNVYYAVRTGFMF
ncbi:MAG: hypothetical protein K2X48_03860 [Chitinophagaceae bacterium]|nr:hypothetical protein [Chitinophagaceae bacterium]